MSLINVSFMLVPVPEIVLVHCKLNTEYYYDYTVHRLYSLYSTLYCSAKFSVLFFFLVAPELTPKN